LSISRTAVSGAFAEINEYGQDGGHVHASWIASAKGPVTGQEVLFDIVFTTPFDLPAGHYFFVPTIQISGDEFFWLSAPKPIVAPGTPFAPDLQSWIRNQDLDPDWSRIGTDVIGAGAFNASFSLDGTTVPEPSTIWLLATCGGLSLLLFRRRTNT